MNFLERVQQQIEQQRYHWMQRVDVHRTVAARTRERLDAFVQTQYGIHEFSRQVDGWFPVQNQPVLCMGRQIPSCSVEALSLSLLRTWACVQGFPCSVGYISFADDGYGNHAYKHSLVRMRILRQKRSSLCIDGQRILCEEDERRLQHQPMLRTLRVRPGSYCGMRVDDYIGLVEFWERMRRTCMHGFEQERVFDIGPCFETWVRECVTHHAPLQPPYIFIEQNERWHRSEDVASALQHKKIRPSAFWYYFLYLALFTTGDRILVASLDEDDAVHEMFAAMDAVRSACGMSPLILWVPYKSRGTYRVPPGNGMHLLHNEVNPKTFLSGWSSRIVLPKTSSPFEAMADLQDQLVRLGP